jgi:uncharacterized protein (TIGR03118 family)
MKNSCLLRLSPATSGLKVCRSLAGLRRIGAGFLTISCIGMTASLASADDVARHYLQTNLVSDIPGLAAATDTNLQNPWGLVSSASSPWWIADNGTGLSTLYTGAGAIQGLVVTVPNAPGVTDPSAPTGIVSNSSTTDFFVTPGVPAHFIFDSENGIISAWSSGPTAIRKVINSTTAVYKGLTIAQNNGANLLYAADFETGTVDVFDTNFLPVNLGADAFRDRRLPRDYAPFNVQSIGASIYVTFAKRQGHSPINEEHGPGLGQVDVFSPAGVLQMRLRHGDWFNAPWGVALAPAGFGEASNRILVGQFGSGKIATFDATSGEFRGMLRGAARRPLTIDGLWALRFGNGVKAGPVTTLFFTAGIDDEAHGLFGTITPINDGDNDADD